MVKIKPFSGLYYYNKYSKANNVSKFVKKALDFDCDGLCPDLQNNDLNVATLQNFNMPNEVSETLKNWLESGVLTVSGGPAFYACEMTYKIADRAYGVRGFFAAMGLPENDSLKVERFDVASQEGTSLVLNLLQKANFQTSSVFALYDDETLEIAAILNEMCSGPCFEKAKHSNVSYKVWEIIDSPLVEQLQARFEQIDKIYLAGGSEVYEAALVNSKMSGLSGNCVLTFFMEKSSDALAVLPFHRVVSMNMFDFEAILSRFSKCFEFVECGSLNLMRNKMFGLRCEGKRSIGVYAEDSFGVLVFSNDFNSEFLGDELKLQLDSFVVDELVVKKLLDSDDCCVQFTNSAGCAKSAVDNGDGCLALFLNAPRFSDLKKIVESGRCVPQRAAYIFPRPVDGLVFYSIES